MSSTEDGRVFDLRSLTSDSDYCLAMCLDVAKVIGALGHVAMCRVSWARPAPINR